MAFKRLEKLIKFLNAGSLQFKLLHRKYKFKIPFTSKNWLLKFGFAYSLAQILEPKLLVHEILKFVWLSITQNACSAKHNCMHFERARGLEDLKRGISGRTSCLPCSCEPAKQNSSPLVPLLDKVNLVMFFTIFKNLTHSSEQLTKFRAHSHSPLNLKEWYASSNFKISLNLFCKN